jgi:hypothetical protein
MFSKTLYTALVLVSLGFAGNVHAADDPTMHQIYAAAEAGQFAEAQSMMDKVLQDHPNSGKAHFVEAELLAKQGRMSNAAAELNKAEALAPGLPFAKSESVQHLKQLVAGTSFQHANGYIGQQPIAHAGGIAWGGLLIGGGLIAALIFGLRAIFSRRTAPTYIPTGNAGYGAATAGQMPQAGGSSGIGSGIVGGLATGAAVGAGMVAGEALAHHFLDGDGHRRDNSFQPPVDNSYLADDDMGGADFGMNDSSWDDSSGGGDDGSW